MHMRSLSFGSLQSTSLIRGKTSFSIFIFPPIVLQSTSLIRGKTFPYTIFFTQSRNFNPLPSSEGRLIQTYMIQIIQELQSTSLIRGKTAMQNLPYEVKVLQSTSLIRGKTCHEKENTRAGITSIHFPHPREDQIGKIYTLTRTVLQSTSLIRGKTTIPVECDCEP